MGGGLSIEIATLLLHYRSIKKARRSALNKHNSLFSFYKDNIDCVQLHLTPVDKQKMDIGVCVY